MLLQLLVTVAVLGLTTFLLVWRGTATWLKRTKSLAVWVERVPGAGGKTFLRAGSEGASGGLLRYVELNPRAVSAEPCLSELKLLSLGDYFASLVPHGTVSWERVLVSIADRYGLTAALPLALFLPNSWRSEKGAGGILASFPSLAASTFLSTTLSTLDLAAFGQTVHMFAKEQRQRRAVQAAAAGKAGGIKAGTAGGKSHAAERAAKAQLAPTLGPLDYLKLGGRPRSGTGSEGKTKAIGGDEEGEGSKGAAGPAQQPVTPCTASQQGGLPNPLLLTRASVVAVAGLTPQQASGPALLPGPAPKPLSPLLPDLHLGNGGLTLTHSAVGAAMCQVMAKVANRLTANALEGLPAGLVRQGGSGASGQQQAQQAQQHERFMVQLAEGGELIDSLEGLLCALRKAGHAVELWLSSNLTSLGMGLSVQSGDGSWQQIPLAYPLRCSGLWTRDTEGRQLDVVTLMSHAAINLRVRGPELNFELEWCLSIEGFTGWLPYVFVARAWATAKPFRTTHPLFNSAADPLSGCAVGRGSADPLGGSQEQQDRAIRLLTCATCVLNLAAQRDRLLFGGYGHIGVCVDSVAAIQQALLGRCTLFPLMLGGEAKLALMALYRDATAGDSEPDSRAEAFSCEKPVAGIARRAGGRAGGELGEPAWEYAGEAAALQQALAQLPYDAVQEPGTAAAACRRALACLPAETSPFAAVGPCRGLLLAALAAAEELCPEQSQPQRG